MSETGIGGEEGTFLGPVNPKNPTESTTFEDRALYHVVFALSRWWGGRSDWGEPVRAQFENGVVFEWRLPAE